MPAMTMAFAVRDGAQLERLAPGDLVTATLVVSGPAAHLTTLRRTGRRPLPEGTPAPPPAPIADGDPVRDAPLVSQDGRPRQLADWRGRALAVTFIYTRCPVPTYCPALDRRFRDAQDALRVDGVDPAAVHLLSVSLDPAHDTPEVLSAHAARAGADPALWTFLTGTPDDIRRFAGQFGVSILPDEGRGEIVHNLRTAVIGADGRLRTVYGGTDWSVGDLVTALKDARQAR
jgi:protein SCO1/2